jgi:hypothetical protein
VRGADRQRHHAGNRELLDRETLWHGFLSPAFPAIRLSALDGVVGH